MCITATLLKAHVSLLSIELSHFIEHRKFVNVLLLSALYCYAVDVLSNLFPNTNIVTSNFSNLHPFFINKRHLVRGYLAMIAPFNCSKVSILNLLVNKIVQWPYTTYKFKHFALLLSLSSSFKSTANSLYYFLPSSNRFFILFKNLVVKDITMYCEYGFGAP